MSFSKMSSSREAQIYGSIQNAYQNQQICNTVNAKAEDINRSVEIIENHKNNLIKTFNTLTQQGINKIKANQEKKAAIIPALDILKNLKIQVNSGNIQNLENYDLALKIIQEA